jgi:hypothetical protein
VEQGSLAVDGRLQNDKEAIPELLPEVVVSTVSVPGSLKRTVQFEHRKPDCKINDAVSANSSHRMKRRWTLSWMR